MSSIGSSVRYGAESVCSQTAVKPVGHPQLPEFSGTQANRCLLRGRQWAIVAVEAEWGVRARIQRLQQGFILSHWFDDVSTTRHSP